MAQGLLNQVQVRHFVPGRARIKLRGMAWTLNRAKALEDFLIKVDGVHGVHVRPATGSVILRFDRRLQKPEDLMERLTSHFLLNLSDTMRLFDSDPDDKQENAPAQRKRRFSNNAPGRMNSLVLWALGGTLAAAAVKRVLFAASLSQGPFSPAGLISLAAVTVLWKKSGPSAKAHHRRIIPMLNAASLLAVANSQALTAVEILFVGHLSLWAEEQSERRAARYLEEAFPSVPTLLDVMENGRVNRRAISEIRPGDIIVVSPKQTISVDGTVAEGSAVADESHLTGRAMPRLLSRGDKVYAGSRLLEGTLHIVAEKTLEETSLARIQALVREGLQHRTELERRAEVFSRWSVTAGKWASLGTLLVTANVRRALAVFLIFSCPCAMVLAASSAVAAAVAAMARRRVIVKNGRAMEAFSALNAACFDKTGTLTEGLLSIQEVVPRASWMPSDDMVILAAAAEQNSPHPIAVALQAQAKKFGRNIPLATEQKVEPGHGIEAQVCGHQILVGSRTFMEKHGVSTKYFRSKARDRQSRGYTVVYVAKDGRLQGFIALGSSFMGDLQSFLDLLRREGFLRIDLISGDDARVLTVFSERFSFDCVHGNLDPEAKARWIEGLSGQGFRVLMVGDGINDTPAFARAHVSVALGPQGAQAALEAADVVLLDGDVRHVIGLRRTARKMIRVAHQNFALATATNVMGFLGAVLGWVPTSLAGLMHLGHMMIILANSSRLLRK